MIIIRRAMKGATMLEVILVVTVIITLIMLSVNQYSSYRRSLTSEQVKQTVDDIFQASANYYYANCKRSLDPTTGLQNSTMGTLDPNYASVAGTPIPPANPFAFGNVNDPNEAASLRISGLQNNGFMQSTIVPNPLVEDTGAPDYGYFVQFNQQSPVKIKYANSVSGPIAIGKVIVWRIQVAVQLKDNTTAQSYKSLLDADCISIWSADGKYIIPCNQVPTILPLNGILFAVWERSPALAVPASNSGLSITKLTSTLLKQQYETLNENVADPNQYYLCGS